MFNYADSDRDGRINYKVDNYKCRLFFQIEFFLKVKISGCIWSKGFPYGFPMPHLSKDPNKMI